MKQTLSITVKGNRKVWSFPFVGEAADIETYRADGLDVGEVLNVVPTWAQRLGLTRFVCAVQDAWQWVRLW